MSRRRAAALLLLSGLLAGCGAEAEKPRSLPPLPSPTTTASPTPSPTPSAADDRAAVEAAVRYYYDGFNRAIAAGDAQELARGSTDTCPCRRKVALLEGLLQKGTVEGNRVTVRSVRIVTVDADEALVQVRYSAADGRLVPSGGGAPQPLRGEQDTSRAVQLAKSGGVWKVTEEVQFAA